MAKEKFSIGDTAEVKCAHLVNGKMVEGWLTGIVVDADYRMAAIQFDTDVYASNGWRIPERILWCAHGSPNIRRPAKTATTAS
jgi:hypothetical protein